MVEKEPKKHDVLSDLLSGGQVDSSPDADDLNSIIYRDPKEARHPSHQSFKLSEGTFAPLLHDLSKILHREEEEDTGEEHKSFRLSILTKKKSTIYFSKKVHLRLKYTKHKLQKLVPDEMKSKISMSSIVNHALKIVLHEFDKKGEQSILLKQMIRTMQK